MKPTTLTALRTLEKQWGYTYVRPITETVEFAILLARNDRQKMVYIRVATNGSEMLEYTSRPYALANIQGVPITKQRVGA